MITVFHNFNFQEAYLGLVLQPQVLPKINFQTLTQVAVVNTDNLGDAFTLVQHLLQPWDQNPKIQTIQQSRSTVIGDVLQTKDGNYWVVGLDDFLLLGQRQKCESGNRDIFQFNNQTEPGPIWVPLSYN